MAHLAAAGVDDGGEKRGVGAEFDAESVSLTARRSRDRARERGLACEEGVVWEGMNVLR